jgi:hypothetical protein
LPDNEKKPEEKQKPDEKKPEEIKPEKKADSSPQWAVELSAKIDKLADSLKTFAEKIPPEEKKPEEKKADKQPEPDKYPKPEQKAVPCGEVPPEKKEGYPAAPEKYPYEPGAKKTDGQPEKYPYGQQDLNKMVETAIENAMKKRFVEIPIEKRGLVGPQGDQSEEIDLTLEHVHQMSWEDVHILAKRLGA